MKILRYTIEAIVEYDALKPEDIEDLLDRIRESGEVITMDVEIVERDEL